MTLNDLTLNDLMMKIMGVLFCVLLSGLVASMLLLSLNTSSRIASIERMGCDDVETVYGERMCQIGDQLYFVDTDCSNWGLDCTAQIVTIGQFTTTPRGGE